MMRRMLLWLVLVLMSGSVLAQDASSLFLGGAANNPGGNNSQSSGATGQSGQQAAIPQSSIPSITNPVLGQGFGQGAGGLQMMMDPEMPSAFGQLGNLEQSGASPRRIVPQQTITIPQQTITTTDPQYQPERSEFQDFVEQSLGRNLPIYGFDLFRNVPSTFAPTNLVPSSPDYVVGPGDEIVINGWGQVDISYRAIVDRNGAITIPKVGTITVAGLQMQNLEGAIKSAIGRVFTNFDLRVTMGRLRSIQVYVVGMVRRPGTYTVSSLSSLVNALFVSGGPSVKGSLRRIELKRGGKTVSEFDMYAFLIKGDKSKDARLLPGDVIYVPPVGPLAAISGSVTSPAIFELRAGDKLADLLELAGGLTVTAAGQKVAVERIVNRQTRQVEDFALDKPGMEKLLRDGDLVRVLPLSPRFDNAVTVRGNVDAVARHPWRNGLRIKDVIPDREALITRDYWVKRNLSVRTDVVDRAREEVRQRDLLALGSTGSQGSADAAKGVDPKALEQIRLSELRALEVKIRESDSGPSVGQERFRNQIRRSLPEVNWDYAVVERLNMRDLTTQLIPFNLGKAVIEGDPTQNIVLVPGDVITVFSKDDIQVPLAKRSVFVKLEGEIGVAGVYQAQPGETLRQLITRVGGLTPNAYLYGAEFERESTRVMQQKRLDESVDRLDQDIQRNLTNRANISREEAAAAQSISEGQTGLIARLRKARATGRIVLEVPMTASQLKDLPDLTLEDGDRFYVPPWPSTVAVVGAVYNANAFIYRPEKRLNDYLSQSGGATKDGDSSSVYLIRADGSVASKRQSGIVFSRFERERMMPGDTLVVPEVLDRYRWTRDLRDWSQILYQFALGVAGLKVLRN